MEREFWHEAWDTGRIGFHRSEVHPDLPRYADTFLSGGPHRVLVPLCGKSLDMLWLAERGHEVVGVEITPRAVEAFFAERGVEPEREEIPGGCALRAGPITILCADWYELSPEVVGPVDRVWDRAALVAVHRERRGEYALQTGRLLGSPGRVLLNAFEYDQRVMSGPPWSVPRAEVPVLYGGLQATLLDSDDIAASITWAGHEHFLVHTWLLSRG